VCGSARSPLDDIPEADIVRSMSHAAHIDAEGLTVCQSGECCEPSEELGRCQAALVIGALLVLLIGVVFFVALVVVVSAAGAAGGCGGG
jgi:hypothetical protein